jgi:hypothetical protein
MLHHKKMRGGVRFSFSVLYCDFLIFCISYFDIRPIRPTIYDLGCDKRKREQEEKKNRHTDNEKQRIITVY